MKYHPDRYYVRQKTGYELGNFINCTPALQGLYELTGKPVPVLFDSPTLQDIYTECPFIHVLTRDDIQGKKCLFDSSLINGWIPDWKFVYYVVMLKCGMLFKVPRPIPHTYVPKFPVPPALKTKPYTVILRAMANATPYWLKMKDPGSDIYRNMIERVSTDYHIVFIGTEQDLGNFIEPMIPWCKKSPTVIIQDIHEALGAIFGAQFVIANDTGLSHVAGAYQKPTFVLWKHTNLRKNKSPNKQHTYSRFGYWERDFEEWINSLS